MRQVSGLTHFRFFDSHLAEIDFAKAEFVGVCDHRDIFAFEAEQGRAVGIEGNTIDTGDDLLWFGDITRAERTFAGEDCHGVGNDQIGLPDNGVEVRDALFHPQQVLTLESRVEETVVGWV